MEDEYPTVAAENSSDIDDNGETARHRKTKINPWDVAHAAAAVVMTFAVVANILTIVAISKYKNLRKTPSSVLLLHLAVMDVVSALSIIAALPFRMTTILGCRASLPAKIGCVVTRYPPDAGIQTSFVILMIIAVDRAVAVKYPHNYKNLITERRMKTVTCFAWVLWLLDPGGYYYYYSYVGINLHGRMAGEYYVYMPAWLFTSILSVKTTGCVVITLILYIYVIVKLRRNSKGVGQSSSGRDKATSRAIKIILVILFCTMIAWFPSFLLQVAYFHFDISLPGSSQFVFVLISVLFYSLPAVNPLVYAWYSKDFRKAYRALLTGNCSPKVWPIESETHTTDQTGM